MMQSEIMHSMADSVNVFFVMKKRNRPKAAKRFTDAKKGVYSLRMIIIPAVASKIEPRMIKGRMLYNGAYSFGTCTVSVSV